MEPYHINRSLLPDEVIKHIQKYISDGNLKPGDRLPSERELSEIFSVGRTTVREALKALDHMGIIDRRRNGTFVATHNDNLFISPIKKKIIFNDISIHELFEMRNLFEVEMVKLAAERRDEEDLAALRQSLKDMKEQLLAHDEVKYTDCGNEFHELIAKAAHNRIYYDLIVAIRETLKENQMRIHRDADTLKNSHITHEQIYEAIENQDPELGRKLMKDHLAEFEKLYDLI